MTRLYHKDIGFPAPIEWPKAGMPLRFGWHAAVQWQRKTGSLHPPPPSQLPKIFECIEVETKDGSVIKWVVRFIWSLTEDAVLVICPNGFVKSAWLNDCDDTHATLNTRRYTKPLHWKSFENSRAPVRYGWMRRARVLHRS